MLSDTEIQKIVSEKILGLTGKKISSINEELVSSGILTSITMAELAVELEKVFSLSLSFMEVNKENFSTTGSIAQLVLKKTRG